MKLKLSEVNNPIGLDISDQTLKLIQLKKQRDKIKIMALGKYKLPEGVIINGEIKNPAAFKKALSELLENPKYGSVNTNEVVACLPETNTYIKLLSIEKGPNEIEKIIGSEIEKNFPLSTKEIYYDWQIIREYRDSYSVLVGAAPRAIVDQYVSALSEARLSITALEIEGMAICRAILAEESKKFEGKFEHNYLIVDIGAVRTSLVAYSHNTIATSISAKISGEAVTSKIAQTLEVSRDQAEKAKIVCGLDKSQAHGIVNDLLNEMISDLIEKIEQTKSYFQNNFPDRGDFSAIILTGGGALIKNLDIRIKEMAKLETINANPFIHLDEVEDSIIKILSKNDGGKDETRHNDSALSYTTAIGLALRSVFIKN
jgi:type IV pilus assembly protein PilM